MPSELITEHRAETLVLTISDPASRNTLSQQVCAAGIELLNVAESDPTVRCVVIQGAGSHFSAGADLERLLSDLGNPENSISPQHAGQALLPTVEGLPEPGAHESPTAHFQQFIEALRVFPKPVIAAVEGTAAGSGFALALGCDLIVAAEDARFSMSYGRMGLSPDGGCTWQLMQLLPRQLVLQVLWFAESSLSPRQLQGFGIVNWVTESGHALEEALVISGRLGKLAAGAIASVKELTYQWPGNGFGPHLAAEAQHYDANLKNPDAREGIEAFLQKRAPRFG